MNIQFKKTILIFSTLLTCESAWAGRPLFVDDASVNEAGNGHIELWFLNAGAGARSVNIAPAYAPIDRLEFALTLSRNTDVDATASAFQGKYILTEARKDGCNLAVAVGASRFQGQSGVNPFGTLIATCNTPWAPVFINIGAVKPKGSSAVTVWGVAIEKEFSGITAHAEVFGEDGGKPNYQIGLRTEVAPKFQLDGTFGRNEGQNIFTLGVKYSFSAK